MKKNTDATQLLGNGNCNSSDDHFKLKSGLDTVGEMNWDKCLLLLVEGREDCEREMEKELSVIPEPLVLVLALEGDGNEMGGGGDADIFSKPVLLGVSDNRVGPDCLLR
ncbi:hypothetical protein BY996DRAFT_6413219 [Phakopsora pachyrhizi]|nr:hypothetical protein BY996DRAFT_6413219 [Phakopsora pachyrhizi]